MFENLTERLTHVFKNITGQAQFTEKNMQQPLQDIRMSLLEADVSLTVVKQFSDNIQQKLLGQKIDLHLKPGQALVKIVRDELVHALGEQRVELNLKAQAPAVILVAGLQGAGKTTSVAKLAKYIKITEKKKIILTSVDIYRPAAIEQLQQLAQQIDVAIYVAHPGELPVAIASKALEEARKTHSDVLIVDTAGRMHIDKDMMDEIKNLHAILNPVETMFVVDSMTGQDAANTAKAFNEALPLTGVILTKTDGDARGGAALSVKTITGKPIKFIGNGEKLDAFEPFYPERIASSILGMGDILGLIENVERKVDQQIRAKLSKKLQKGKKFDLDDFKQQLLQFSNFGGISEMMNKLPMLSGHAVQSNATQPSEQLLGKMVAVINSMTKKERMFPKIIAGSRKRRIACGSGTTIPDVNRVLKQYENMQVMVKKFKKPGAEKKMARSMESLQTLQGASINELKKFFPIKVKKT